MLYIHNINIDMKHVLLINKILNKYANICNVTMQGFYFMNLLIINI